MITIRSFRDLEQFGIIPLTGEADALGFRILCDLTAFGRQIVCESLGLLPCGFPESWNSGSKDDPHVGCVMLSTGEIPSLGVIALTKYCHTVISLENLTVVGLESGEEIRLATYDFSENDVKPITLVQYRTTIDGDWIDWPEGCYGKIQRLYCHGTNPHVGTRNVHAMSGRVV